MLRWMLQKSERRRRRIYSGAGRGSLGIGWNEDGFSRRKRKVGI